MKVLLADDHTRVLASVEDLLRTDFRIVAAVTDGRLALEAAKKLNPDVVVLDITMPGLDGLIRPDQRNAFVNHDRLPGTDPHVPGWITSE